MFITVVLSIAAVVLAVSFIVYAVWKVGRRPVFLTWDFEKLQRDELLPLNIFKR